MKISEDRKKKQIDLACRQCFDYMNTIGRRDWDIEDSLTGDRKQIIYMVFYNLVYKFGSEASGWEDIDCRKQGIKTSDDHFLSPRMGCLALMNQKRELLNDYDEFKKFFTLLRTTVKVKKKSNDTSENKFKNDNGKISIKNLTEDKYKPEGSLVRLWIRKRDSNPLDPKEGFPLANLIPDFFKKEELKYLVGSRAKKLC